MLHFYMSVAEIAICFAAICWGSGIRTSDSKKLNKLMKKAVLGTALESLELIMQGGMLQKLLNIKNNTGQTH